MLMPKRVNMKEMKGRMSASTRGVSFAFGEYGFASNGVWLLIRARLRCRIA
jgi:hypothetical protein